MQIKALKPVSSTRAMTWIMTISLVVFAFLLWLVYFKERIGYSNDLIASLPAFNAFFNGVSTVLLILGFRAIKGKQQRIHQRFMVGALISSTLFLISYITYHSFHGDSHFQGVGIIRPVYFFILITHISLSAVVVPLILSSFFFGLSGKFPSHRKISRWTYPIWLYVSVTGVLIFFLLKLYS
ncbi:MAG: DUF420 domain-containing protein [Candidatus Kapaibacterium sp.]